MRNSNRITNPGDIFGWWTVIEAEPVHGSKVKVSVQCRCGKIKNLLAYSLQTGRTKSCGCDRRNHPKTTMEGLSTKHHKMYRIWWHMIARCENPNEPGHEIYGGRGIKVCERWRNSFKAFLEDMGEKPKGNYSIDRIDSNGNYTPENCRWATKKEQSNNRRDNLRITFNGECHTPPEWEEITGIPAFRIRERFYAGWPIEHVLDPRDTRYLEGEERVKFHHSRRNTH